MTALQIYTAWLETCEDMTMAAIALMPDGADARTRVVHERKDMDQTVIVCGVPFGRCWIEKYENGFRVNSEVYV